MLDKAIRDLVSKYAPALLEVVVPLWGDDRATEVVRARAKCLAPELIALGSETDRLARLRTDLERAVAHVESLRGSSDSQDHRSAFDAYVKELRRDIPEPEVVVGRLVDYMQNATKPLPLPQSEAPVYFLHYVGTIARNAEADERRKEGDQAFRAIAQPTVLAFDLAPDEARVYAEGLRAAWDLHELLERALAREVTSDLRNLQQVPPPKRRSKPGPLGMQPRFFDLLTGLLTAADVKPEQQWSLLDIPPEELGAIRSRRQRARQSNPALLESELRLRELRRIQDELRSWLKGGTAHRDVLATLALAAQTSLLELGESACLFLVNTLRRAGLGLKPGDAFEDTCRTLVTDVPNGVARLVFVLLRNLESNTTWMRKLFDATNGRAFIKELPELPQGRPIECFGKAMKSLGKRLSELVPIEALEARPDQMESQED